LISEAGRIDADGRQALIAAGVDVRTVAGRLGHADPSTTLRIYAAFMEPADQGAARVMQRLLGGAPTPPRPRRIASPRPAPKQVTQGVLFKVERQIR
jgi:hypothetical protein